MISIVQALETPGWMSDSELSWLAQQASSHNAIVEIGAYLGRSTRALGDNTSGMVITIDDWFGPRAALDLDHNGKPFRDADREGLFDQFKRNLGDLIEADKVFFFKSDFSDYDSIFISMPDFHPDMVFIDGDHSYEAVKRDIEYWMKKLSSGGLISGHDSNHGPVADAVRDLLGEVSYGPQTCIWFKTI